MIYAVFIKEAPIPWLVPGVAGRWRRAAGGGRPGGRAAPPGGYRPNYRHHTLHICQLDLTILDRIKEEEMEEKEEVEEEKDPNIKMCA